MSKSVIHLEGGSWVRVDGEPGEVHEQLRNKRIGDWVSFAEGDVSYIVKASAVVAIRGSQKVVDVLGSDWGR